MVSRAFPGEDVVLAGVDRAIWDALLAGLAAECGAGNRDWHAYSKNAPWSMRVKRGERVIVYLTPQATGFRASFALGAAALGLVREAGYGALLDGAKKYAEGTAVRVNVVGMSDVEVVLALARAKIRG